MTDAAPRPAKRARTQGLDEAIERLVAAHLAAEAAQRGLSEALDALRRLAAARPALSPADARRLSRIEAVFRETDRPAPPG